MTARRHEPVLVLPRERYGRRRQHWLAARRAGITATDAAVLLGVDPWQSPLGLYVDKLAGDDVDEQTEAMYWGNKLEHVVATEWQVRNRDTGLRIVPTPGLLAHPDRPWQMATIDRYAAPGTQAEPVAVVEAKTTDSRHSEKWQEDQPPPLRVVAQVQHQMLVTGLDVAYVAALIGGNRYRQWEIPFDADLGEQITEIEVDFLARLERRDPPAPIGHDADDDALDALFTAASGTAAEVDPDLVERRRELDEQEKAAKAEKKAIEQQIKAALGDATEGLGPDGRPLVTWREQHRDPYTVPAADFRVLRFKPSKKENIDGAAA